MKYIRNTGRYAVAFIITKNNREFKLELDKQRHFMDTGNIATTGITPVEEKDIEELKKQKYFNQLLEKGSLEILEEDQVRSPEENKAKALEEENKKLKEQLKKANKEDNKEVIEANKALTDENTKLKAQLEALKKESKKETKAETEGF